MDSKYSFEDVDFLLKRDWFMSVEDIEDLIWELHQHVFDRVLEHRLEYSYRIQDVLMPYVVQEPKVKDLTDEMMAVIWKEKEDRMQKKWEESKRNFIPPPRERTIFDEMHDDLKKRIDALRMEEPKSRARKTQIAAQLETLQNEFEKIKERVVSQDNVWTELQWIESVALARERLT